MLPLLTAGGTLLRSKAAKRVGRFLGQSAGRLLQRAKSAKLQKLGTFISTTIEAKARGGAVPPPTAQLVGPAAAALGQELVPYEETRDRVTKEIDKILGDSTKSVRTMEAGKTWYYLAAGVALIYLLKK